MLGSSVWPLAHRRARAPKEPGGCDSCDSGVAGCSREGGRDPEHWWCGPRGRAEGAPAGEHSSTRTRRATPRRRKPPRARAALAKGTTFRPKPGKSVWAEAGVLGERNPSNSPVCKGGSKREPVSAGNTTRYRAMVARCKFVGHGMRPADIQHAVKEAPHGDHENVPRLGKDLNGGTAGWHWSFPSAGTTVSVMPTSARVGRDVSGPPVQERRSTLYRELHDQKLVTNSEGSRSDEAELYAAAWGRSEAKG